MPVIRYMGISTRGLTNSYVNPLPRRSCRITLNKYSLAFNPTIEEVVSGHLYLFYNSDPTLASTPDSVNGIRVNFEVDVKVRFKSKVDNRVDTHVGNENVLSNQPWSEVYVIGDKDAKFFPLPGKNLSFPFSFKMMKCLPASIDTFHLAVTYQVVAYAPAYQHTGSSFQEIARSDVIKSLGYYNLATDPKSIESINLEKCIYKSLFCKKMLVRANLNVEKTGFLPGEKVEFTLKVNNVSGEYLRYFRVSFLRRVTYRIGHKSKSMVTIFKTHTKEESNGVVDSSWEDVFLIPVGIQPSFDSQILHIQYCLKMEIFHQNDVWIKCEADILVGTVDQNKDYTDGSQNLNFLMKPVSGNSTSCHDLRHDSEVSSMLLVPPNYSTLSSRRQSAETLPPDYKDMTSCFMIPYLLEQTK